MVEIETRMHVRSVRTTTVDEIAVATIDDVMTDRSVKISVIDVTTDQRVVREANHLGILPQNALHDDPGTKIGTQELNIAKLVKRLRRLLVHRDQAERLFVVSPFDDVIKNVNQTRKS